jgi:hypothetical protein
MLRLLNDENSHYLNGHYLNGSTKTWGARRGARNIPAPGAQARDCQAGREANPQRSTLNVLR